MRKNCSGWINRSMVAAGVVMMCAGRASAQCDNVQEMHTSVDYFMWILEDDLGCPTQQLACSSTWVGCADPCSFQLVSDSDADCSASGSTAAANANDCLPPSASNAATNPPCAASAEGLFQVWSHMSIGAIAWDCPGGICINTASAAAVPVIDLDRPSRNWAIYVIINGSASITGAGGGARQRWSLAATFNSGVHVLAGGMSTGGDCRVFGASPTSSGVWELALDSSSGLGYALGPAVLASVDDVAMDYNGDGRFNAADVAALTSFLGLSWPSGYGRFDLDKDGVVDQAEIDALQRLLDAGLDAGAFGDVDGDGGIDCDDLAAAPAGPYPIEFGDADYRIQLDDDLDGVVTTAEQLKFYKVTHHGDFNLDGFQDFFDYDDYAAAFIAGGEAPDWNLDGFLDFFDSSDFAYDFEHGC